MIGLVDKIVTLHTALDVSELPHAFGGALALAYCVSEPRSTQDIDVNVFVEPERVDVVVDALPREVKVTATARRQLEKDAQARLFWGSTPVDVFLSNHTFHRQAEANRRMVAFGSIAIPVLACADLAVFKAFFDRPKDAVDVAAMVSAGAIDVDGLERDVNALLGEGERTRFFSRVREFASEVS